VPAIVPARLGFSADGTPWSETYADVYHTASGGLGQARHVFLGGNDLPARWRGRERFVIVETGFGLGLNFLATWQAWRDDPRRCERLHFVSVEKHPLARADLERALGAHDELAALARALIERWPPLVSGFQRIDFEQGRVVLTLLFGEALDGLAQLEARADAFYLDGHAPERNPDMWSAALFAELARLAAPGATLATWCVAGPVRAALAEAGFVLQKRPGFARKREMLAGHRPGSPASVPTRDRRAMVLGAGLAGSACAWHLARRGWSVTVIERHPGPAQAASGNLAGVVKPVVAARETRAARIARAGFLRASALWPAAFDHVRAWHPAGVLQVARDAAQAERFAHAVRDLALPADFARRVDRDEAETLAGYAVSASAVWLPGAGMASGPALCAARLSAPGIAARFDTEVATLIREQNAWVARDAHGAELARAPIAILANGSDARHFSALPIQAVRGQLSYLPAGSLPRLGIAVCREGCVYPAPDGRVCLGASYDEHDDPTLRDDSHAENLARLERMLPGTSAGIDVAALAGRVGFRAVTPDRLPLAGALAEPGLFALLGLGSRGLVWSDLCAELLAAQLEDEPWPLERELAAALAAARFVSG
jgi:tRNA 5-methylaminomethyl-2-thiouridine biosynthesis bifunctional protein